MLWPAARRSALIALLWWLSACGYVIPRAAMAPFESRAIAVTGANTGRITGDLTLRGVTRPVSLDISSTSAATFS